MNAHLTDQELNAYLHQTLNDAQRETLDAHLTSCPTCRAHLSELNVLQQRVRRELTAELKAANVPLSLTFEAIAPRLQPPSRATRLWHYSRQTLLGMTAVAALLMVVIVLANTASPTADQIGGRLISNTGRVGGWYIDGDAPASYEFGVDQSVAYTGQASGFIRSKADVPKGIGALMQGTPADSYHGKRIRLSAYIKTEEVERQTGLWLRINRSQIQTLSFADMNNRPIQGTTDWQKYDLVLDVPNEATSISFAFFLMGRGQVWVDDVQLEIVGQEVATTETTEDPPLVQPTNLDFEAGLEGWLPERNPQNYTTSIDTVNVYGGQASAHIQSKQANPISSAVLVQSVKAEAYRGKRLRVTAYLKFEKVDATVQLVAGAFGSYNTKQKDINKLIYSTPLWQRQSLVFEVPENSDRIAFGVIMQGEGQIWVDDVQVEAVGTDVALTLPEQLPGTAAQPSVTIGHDLDQSFSGWVIAGTRPQDYEMGFDSEVVHTGKSSAYVKSMAATAPEFGTFMTIVDAANYRGKRVRLTAHVKAEQVESQAGLWLRVDGPESTVLGFDNMQNRPIQGTHDWQKCEVVLDVPENSVDLAYGILLADKGQVWLDNVQLQVVDQSVPITGYETKPPTDLGFEIQDQSWAVPEENTLPTLAPTAQAMISSTATPPPPLHVHFGNVATLTDAHWSPDELKPGESLELSLHWTVSPASPALTIFVYVVDSNDHVVVQSDQPLPNARTSEQTVSLKLPAEMADKIYFLAVVVSDTKTGSPLTTDQGKVVVQLTQFVVGSGFALPSFHPAETQFGDVAKLVATSLSDTRFKPGDTLTLDLSWDISRAEGYTSFVHVLDSQDQVVAQADLSLESIKARNVRGQPNVPYLIGQSKIQLPADLADGEYHLAVGIYDNQTGQRVTNNLGQTAVMIASFEVGPDLIITSDTKHVHLVNPPQGYFPPVESHFEVAIRNACADLGCETQPMTCVGSSCSPYSPALTVTVYVDPKATSLYGWMYEDQLMFKMPTPDSTQGLLSIFDVPDSLTLLVEKVARSVYGWPPQTMSGLPIFSGIVDWETYQLDQRLGSAKLSNPFQPNRLAGTTMSPLESLWVPGPIVSETREMQAEAAALIAFVEKEFGAPAVGKLLKSIGHANSLPEAIESSLNLKYSDFEQRWLTWLKQYNLK